MTASHTHFPRLCKQWRRRRHLSQLDLAESAAVSQRHLSWLETGRSQPSREMVLRLAEALEVPLRERNTLLNAAGFAAQFRESALHEAHMQPIRRVLEQMLAHHEPLPAVVVDRRWNQVMGNRASELLLELAQLPGKDDTNTPFNLAAATLEPGGLRRFIRNWEVAIPMFVQRLRSEAQVSGDSSLIAYVEALIRSAGELPGDTQASTPLFPVLPLELDIHGLQLSLFSVMSTFGTPQDVTTDELRIEAFYPSDEATREFFTQRGNA